MMEEKKTIIIVAVDDCNYNNIPMHLATRYGLDKFGIKSDDITKILMCGYMDGANVDYFNAWGDVLYHAKVKDHENHIWKLHQSSCKLLLIRDDYDWPEHFCGNCEIIESIVDMKNISPYQGIEI
jgi:hypothetical protein